MGHVSRARGTAGERIPRHRPRAPPSAIGHGGSAHARWSWYGGSARCDGIGLPTSTADWRASREEG
eukprot:5733492-Prymnesium_polylepis.1